MLRLLYNKRKVNKKTSIMKRLLLFILPFIVLSACLKEKEEPIIIEPPVQLLLDSDTLVAGEKWGLTIGESTEALYPKIKELQFAKPITYLGIVGNVFTGIDGLESTIPLYQSVFLDETKGTSSGIQISFSDDKVNSIYTNEGKSLTKWPSNTNANATILKGDQIDKIYGKLANISKISSYAKKFERVSIFSKDVAKDYDPYMSLSSHWEFYASMDEKKHYEVSLDFKEGKLISIAYRLYQTM
ncbi:hypothetical protein ADIARSV_3736 [Arcticibacter svalbardensis MN12-7]|uniref:Lipoprotein n=2 Tax=Arcticibacter TaxID=1288026 RepID=R9GN16_9SPHI|nr:hypothetical protein ADIARSV_3736 [Arcticibacter svalbardensis MN12-7]